MNTPSLLVIARTAPADTLLARVLTALYHKQEQSRLWRVRVFAASALLSLAALVPVVVSLIQAIKTSNFGIYASLIFSDGSAMASFWKPIGVLLVESLPAISIGATLALMVILLWSLQKMLRFMHSSTIKTVSV